MNCTSTTRSTETFNGGPGSVRTGRHLDPQRFSATCLDGRDAISRYYRDLLAGVKVSSVEVILRITDRWFVLTELALRLRRENLGDVQVRLADICVMGRDDKLLVHLGTSAAVER
jgi:hypothetical protein